MKMELNRSLFGIDSVRSMMSDSYSPVSMGVILALQVQVARIDVIIVSHERTYIFNERTIVLCHGHQKPTNGAMIKNQRSESNQCYEQDTANVNHTSLQRRGIQLVGISLLALRVPIAARSLLQTLGLVDRALVELASADEPVYYGGHEDESQEGNGVVHVVSRDRTGRREEELQHGGLLGMKTIRRGM